MTTVIAGGRISTRIALTLQAQSALAIGTPVKLVGDYLCDVGDATHPFIGIVDVPNVARGTGSLAGTYPQPQVPGDVTIETIGHGVATVPAGTGGMVSGDAVKISSSGTYIIGAGPSDASFCGYALTTAAAGANFDLLLV